MCDRTKLVPLLLNLARAQPSCWHTLHTTLDVRLRDMVAQSLLTAPSSRVHHLIIARMFDALGTRSLT